MTEIAVRLSDEEVRTLSRLARDGHVSEQELIRQAVEELLDADRRPDVPRYARRLGPLT